MCSRGDDCLSPLTINEKGTSKDVGTHLCITFSASLINPFSASAVSSGFTT